MAAMRFSSVLFVALATLPLSAQTSSPAPAASAVGVPHIAPGAKVFIQPMDGFDTYLSAAILKKKVPVTVVDTKEAADYVIAGSAQNEKAGWAKTIFVSPNSHASASITVKDAKTGALAFAYNVDKGSSARGNQSTAEACAKHLKQAIEAK